MTLERDSLLHKRYRIIESLGQGGMGSVYRAVDENLGVDVAVKENLFTTDEYARQFRLEAVILANLRHPNLPRVSDHFIIEDQGQYLIMDFIEGEDLRQRMERVGLLSEDDVIHIGAAICDALGYLHARKPAILHRDLKPGNVKITSDGHIFLVDFGLAKVVNLGSQATTTGARAMTPGYSPPEQYGTARTDQRTDIYSLGATLYAALTGSIPEDGLARAMDNAELTPLRKRNPRVTKRLAAVIEKAMAIDPGDRYQTAEDFKNSLLSSKSKPEQLTGTYTVDPPPSIGSDSRTSKPVAVKLMPSTADGKHPFVSPKKKKQQKDTRRRMQFVWVLLGVILCGYIGAGFFFPDILPENARSLFQFGSDGKPTAPATNVPTAVVPIIDVTSVPKSSPTVQSPTATPLVASPTSDITVTPTSTFIPTPIGAEKLQLSYASIKSDVAQIYVTDLLGNVKQVTNMQGGACQPSWSPDGKQMVFISPCKLRMDTYPNSSLYVVNADGSDLQPLPVVPGGDFEPAWSPTGTQIAFTSLRDGYMQIYLYDLQNGDVTRLVETGDRSSAARQAAWSPDGKRIVYSVKRVGEAYQIWTMTDKGRDQLQLLRSGDGLSDYLPTWSPDGKLILFTQRSVKEFYPTNLMIFTLGSSDQARRLNMGVLTIEDVKFSKNGFWLAFESGPNISSDIYYMTATGANLTQLTTNKKDDFDPAWRPIQTP
jgi:serine/threonine protein kinase/Tol biopolymer transport system component